MSAPVHITPNTKRHSPKRRRSYATRFRVRLVACLDERKANDKVYLQD